MSLPAPDYDAAVAQLQAERPGGPWNISTGEEGATFTDPEKAKRWMEKRNRNGENIYRSPNVAPNPTGANGRALKSDIPAADHTFVDCDVYKDELAPDESWRALSVPERKARLAQELNEGKYGPAPTWTVDSGGGLQPIWRLEDPVPVGESERMNLWLAERIPFGDPGTWNGDRLLRVPGTINWPDAKKKAMGRVPVVAKVLASNDTMLWDADFGRAKPKSAEKDEVDIVLNPIFPKTLDDLHLSERTKTIVENGRLPQAKTGDDSGSAWLFDCMISLLREGVDPNVVLGIVTDSTWGISKTIDKHAHTPEEAEHYAARQVRRAMGTLQAERKKLFPDDVDEVLEPYLVDTVTEEDEDPNERFDRLWRSVGQRDPATIPLTAWVVHDMILSRDVSVMGGMGGAGKSLLMYQLAISVALNDNEFAGWKIDRPGPVLILAGEDDEDEVDRRVVVACKARGIDRSTLNGKVIVLKDRKLRLLRKQKDGNVVRTELYDDVRFAIKHTDASLLVVDPKVKVAYGFLEGDNDDQDVLIEELRALTKGTACGIMGIAHFAKGANAKSQGAIRGASSFVDGSRATFTVAAMTADEHATFKPPKKASMYVQLQNPKQNYGPHAMAAWYEMRVIDVGNGGDMRPALMPVEMVESVESIKILEWEHLTALMDLVRAGRGDGVPWSRAVAGPTKNRLTHALANAAGIKPVVALKYIQAAEMEGMIRAVEGVDKNRNAVQGWEANPDYTGEDAGDFTDDEGDTPADDD